MTIFKQQDESSAVSTVVIRGATGLNLIGHQPTFVHLMATENTLDNFERAVDDGVNTFKTLTKDPRVVAGAGATEIEIATQLAAFAATREGLEQYSIRAFAEAFEVVPFALAENTGLKARHFCVHKVSD